jgi:hypothetical protein
MRRNVPQHLVDAVVGEIRTRAPGSERGITGKALIDALASRGVVVHHLRTVGMAVREARLQGAQIGSTSRSGYFWIVDARDRAITRAEAMRRASAIFEVLRVVDRKRADEAQRALFGREEMGGRRRYVAPAAVNAAAEQGVAA